MQPFSNYKEGLSQSDRWLKTIDPENVEIEGREIHDFIKFLHELSSEFHYYNNENKPDGTWEDLIISDPYLLIIVLSKVDLLNTTYNFEKIISGLYMLENNEEIVSDLNKVLDFLMDFISSYQEAKNRISILLNNKEFESYFFSMENIDKEILELKYYSELASIEFNIIKKDSVYFSVIENVNNQSFERIFLKGESITDKILNSISNFTKIYDSVLSKFSPIIFTAAKYVKKEDFTKKKYPPHLALLITFLDLYGHLKNQINGITRRHLNFYYEELIGIQLKPERPDFVNVLLEQDKKASNKILKKENYLIAQVPYKELPVKYKFEKDIVLSKAEIVELKTTYVSDYLQMISLSDDMKNVNEAQVFSSDNPIYNPSIFEELNTDEKAWMLFGEDQHDLSENLRTMKNSDVGIVISSPLLYQTEGERQIKLTFHLKSIGVIKLKDYINNFSKISGKKEIAVISNLFSNIFLIDYSTDEGWEKINKYEARIDLSDEVSNTLEIYIKIQPTDKSFAVFNSNVHGLNCTSNFPMIRMLINNFTEHNAYSFLSKTLLDRVTINVKVKGFKDLKIQNNIGPLSHSVPFTPFGPQPVIGSFLDMKNSNVFNRYTKNFSFNIKWINLPKDENGFNSYYKAYDLGYSNDAFKISISGLNGGVFRPEVINQQRFDLFQSKRNSSELENTTIISEIDFKKIEFLNNPQLQGEKLFTENNFKDGAIRLELCSPINGFGHSIFPQLFPKVIINNSKKFKKKLLIPNPPYIPTIKSISVDFEIEFSENFIESSNNDLNIQLFHIYPFGYKNLFPDNEKKSYFLLPQIEDSGNLFIGLLNAEPNSLISILFQIDEKGFHHTMHNQKPTKWSYLQSNTWIDFESKNILSDSTNSFINSGIISIRIPNEVKYNNTILNSELFWIRVSNGKSNTYQPKVLAIHINAFRAVRVDDGQIDSVVYQRLEKGAIKKFLNNSPGIKNIWQPFPSYAGRHLETIEKYYIRVSERLRHKQRPSQSRDIEQLILEAFPQIMIVKCFNTQEQNFIVQAGVDLQVVLIPKEPRTTSYFAKEPMVSLSDLYQIKAYLNRLTSSFVKIEVGNPVYEKVKIICKIMFVIDEKNDSGALERKFTEDINQYIAPWLFGKTTEIKIGSKIFLSELKMFISSLPYINYLTEFSVIHFYNIFNTATDEVVAKIIDSSIGDVNYISGSTPLSVLIPSSTHNFTILNMPEFKEARKSGIGDFVIGEEFLIVETKTADKSEIDDNSLSNFEDEELFDLIINHNIE